jgi:C4-dicarboxylate-binding protein DctP
MSLVSNFCVTFKRARKARIKDNQSRNKIGGGIMAFKRRTLARSVMAAFMLVGLLSGEASSETFKMKLGIVTQNDPIHVYIQEFEKRIEAKTNGRIQAEVYPSAQLGGTPRLIEGIQFGTIEMILLPPGFFKGVDPAFQVTEAPGLFRDIDHAHAVLTDPVFHDPFLKIAEKKGIIGVSLWVYGPTSYASLIPLQSIAEFEGKKFRVMASKVETDLMKAIGATGVAMPFDELTSALQTKAIDGVRSNIMVLSGIKMFSIAKHITLVDDSMIAVTAMASKMFMDKLPADLKAAVLEVGREMEPHMLKVAKQYNTNAETLWREQGEIIKLPKPDQKRFMETGAGVADAVLSSDKGTKDLFALLKETAKKHE